MNVEQQIYTVLAADSPVAALVVSDGITRIYPMLMPPLTTMPAVSYQRVSTVPQNGLSGHHSIDHVRVQIDCWDDDYAGVKTLAAAVRTAMYTTPLFALPIMEIDDYDSEAKLFRVILDFNIWN